jgi:hypothetical protein
MTVFIQKWLKIQMLGLKQVSGIKWKLFYKTINSNFTLVLEDKSNNPYFKTWS